MRQPTAKSFLKDVAEHKMTVHLEQGVYRNIRFQKPQNSNMWFELVTWPGVLTIHGDMGTWTFSRVQDMFTFFRDDQLRINADYWAEKLRAGVHGGSDSSKVWEEESFKSRLISQLKDYYGLTGKKLKDITAAVQEDICSHDCRYDMLIAARDFSYKGTGREVFQFDTCELPDGMGYAYHFIWCLYAIVWGIQQWDKEKAGV